MSDENLSNEARIGLSLLNVELGLLDQLREEADLCRNETADDIAVLLDKAADEIERLRKGLFAAEQLMNESRGVAGLHMNGDVAPWSDLRAGGCYEEWLVDFDAALPPDMI